MEGPSYNISQNLTDTSTSTSHTLLNMTMDLTTTDKMLDTKDPVDNATKWTNGFIILLGFFTNSLIILILSRKRIGSKTTRIVLMFLAVTDLIVMIVELFVHYIPWYWKWFPIFYTESGCAVATFVQATAITVSAWYLMLMTVERFIAVWFPMKAKLICTWKTVLGCCIGIPLLLMPVYSYILIDFTTYKMPDSNYVWCKPKQTATHMKGKLLVWIVLYFFLPAVVISVLNTLIACKLCTHQKHQRKLTRSTSVKSTGRAASVQGIRKATTLVIMASVSFVLMMIPRGVYTAIYLDISWEYMTRREIILDAVAYQLQYLNHASNFFIYVIANNSFRSELIRILCWCCRKETPSMKHLKHHLDHTRMSYIMTATSRSNSHNSCETEKLTTSV